MPASHDVNEKYAKMICVEVRVSYRPGATYRYHSVKVNEYDIVDIKPVERFNTRKDEHEYEPAFILSNGAYVFYGDLGHMKCVDEDTWELWYLK